MRAPHQTRVPKEKTSGSLPSAFYDGVQSPQLQFTLQMRYTTPKLHNGDRVKPMHNHRSISCFRRTSSTSRIQILSQHNLIAITRRRRCCWWRQWWWPYWPLVVLAPLRSCPNPRSLLRAFFPALPRPFSPAMELSAVAPIRSSFRDRRALDRHALGRGCSFTHQLPIVNQS